MQSQNKIQQNNNSVEEFITSIADEQTVKDCHQLIAMMHRISEHEPKMWGQGIIGFDSYHYKYESGREGDCQPIGFHPRKGKITIYLMDGTIRYTQLLSKLGKHTTSRVCLYLKRLSDIDITVLEQIVRASYDYVKSQDGTMHRALE